MPVERATPERVQELVHNYEEIVNQVQHATEKRGPGPKPRLVVVTKLKPSSDIQALYEHGIRHFGENYPQELEGKAKELPEDIAWHYIGTLQSNKCKMLASIPNLFAIETLTSAKAANQLQSTLASLPTLRSAPLNVFIQINTSGEEQKSGLPALSGSQTGGGEVVDLAAHILEKCPALRLRGLMTIGSLDSSVSAHPNPDFERLKETRTALLAALRARDGLQQAVEQLVREQEGGLELSMGMSNDFVEAIEQGSTNVRVGSSIMGARPPRPSS
ncbi:hypothetical protein JCM3774_000062 [Rhodotorula dairenensis]